jgi:hypothetical protein
MTTLGTVKLNGSYDWIMARAPLASDDGASGYAVGDRWLDYVTGLSYRCDDATGGLAIWSQIEQSTDNKINLALARTQASVLAQCVPTILVLRQSRLTGVSPDEIARYDYELLLQYVSTFASWTFAEESGETEITPADADEQSGAFSVFEVGDEIVIRGSRRNDGIYPVAGITDTALTITGELIGSGDTGLIALADVPAELEAIIGRMIWYDTQLRGKRLGLNSESIGTYSYVNGFRFGALSYPVDVVAGLETYFSTAPRGGVNRVE